MMSELQRQLVILLVDDDPDVLDVTDQMLAHLGYTTITTCDPGDAAEILRDPRTEIDALVTDFCIGQINGADLARQASRSRPGFPTLFVSGDPLCVARFRSSDPFLQKPFTLTELQQALDRIFRSAGQTPHPHLVESQPWLAGDIRDFRWGRAQSLISNFE